MPTCPVSETIRVSSFEILCKIGRDDDYPLSGRYELVCDIDASSSRNGTRFEPIGSIAKPFTGTLDGNGFTISGLFINMGRSDAVGLFGFIGKSAEVRGVRISADIIKGKDSVGGLAGVSRGRVTNCGFSGTVSGKYNVGGLVGSNDGTGSVSRQCYSSGRVRGIDTVGGLVGKNWGDIAEGCTTGKVTGEFHVGGLVGENWGGNITECCSLGDVAGRDGVGGLIGQCNISAVSQCYSTGKVSGKTSVGGLAGECNGGAIRRCYSIGKVSGASIGGLVGHKSFENEVTDSYWDTAASNANVSQGGKGKSTAKMRSRATYENWDFEKVWRIDEGVGYPRLRAFDEASIPPSASGA